MGVVQELVIQYRANVTQAVKGLEEVNRQVKRTNQAVDRSIGALTSKMTSMGTGMTIGVTAPLLLAGKAAVKMAMDAVESENLFAVSMGKMASQARGWSEQVSKSLGLNSFEIRKNVSTFNAMFDSMKMGTSASYEMAKGLTQLSYDMASFYNLKPEEAFEKLQAGISGETEPLKRLGIIVNETTAKTWAYTNGLAKQGAALTEQQKVLARYGVIMESTKKAQGDMARTIDSPTNALRSLTSQIQETTIKFGTLLIPTVAKAIGKAKEYTTALQAMSDSQRKFILDLGLIAAASGPAIVGLSAVVRGVYTLRAAFLTAGAAGGALALAIAGIAGAGAVIKTGIDKTWSTADAGSNARASGKASRQADIERIKNGLANDYTKGAKRAILKDYMAEDIFNDMPYGGPAAAYKALKSKKSPSVLEKRQITQYEQAVGLLRKVESGTDTKHTPLNNIFAGIKNATGNIKPVNPFKSSRVKAVPKGVSTAKKPGETEQERDDRLSQAGLSWIANMVSLDKMSKEEEIAALTRIQKKYPGASLGTRAQVYTQRKSLMAVDAVNPMDALEAELDKVIAEQERNARRNGMRQRYVDEAKKAKEEELKVIADRIKAYRQESEEKRKSVYEQMEAERQRQRDSVRRTDPQSMWMNTMIDSIQRRFGGNRNNYIPGDINRPITANEVVEVNKEILDENRQQASLLSQMLDVLSPPVRAIEGSGI